MTFTIVETSLNRAEFRWKWLKFLKHSFVLGTLVCLLVCFFGLAILLNWVTTKGLAVAFLALLGAVAFVAWAVIVISILAGAPDRKWLAAAIERVDRRLRDRLNTLLFLERRTADRHSHSFAVHIARQLQSVLAAKASPAAFAPTQTMQWFLAFIIMLSITLAMFHLSSPWARLLEADTRGTAETMAPEKPPDLALPPTNNIEQQQSWGEVRVTDPGADLRVTKVDVVPLQIEAAANQALTNVAWFSTINGAGEVQHQLPPPTEPRYAVYQPTIYMDELRLSDWDVMTYYAKAHTEKSNSYASEMYFLEVRPFREDILKMPGGENGKAYEALNEMSTLIGRQQHVIRQTHQHIQAPQPQAKLQEQDRRKLSQAESDLSDSAQHLYAKMAAEMENTPIGDALDNLAKAEKSLDGASKLLDANVMPEAQGRERTALAELVAARKVFQKAVSENPKAFEEPKDEQTPPVADSAKKLNEMAEFRNEAKAAQEFVQKSVDQQSRLERQAASGRGDSARLGEQERQLEQSLEEFQQQHPHAFKEAQAESKQAQQSMNKAADALEKRTGGSRAATHQATQDLTRLSDAMRDRSAEEQLAQAYRLKQMLDKQIQTLGKCANPVAEPGGSPSAADVQQVASDAKETVNQLKRAAEQEPTRDAFGQPLRDALSGTNKVDTDAKLTQLQQAEDAAARQQRAGEAKESLGKISKAFEASQPQAMQAARGNDALKPGQQESFNLGLAELDSLIKQQESNRKLSPGDRAAQEREALSNLRTGMRDLYGNEERGMQILAQLDEQFKKDAPVDVELLKKLVNELEHFSVETADRLATREDKPQVTNIDPSRLPPAYRGRIQKYFQRLSEK
ncbi:MAG TPA: hypothetical protein VMU04_18685 [Candidatus Acidoferrum sp.]|nr:hypothetical protein [Candidatus Acidoferrum sp.]